MIVSISKSGISRRGSDHCVRSRSDLSRSSMLWTKRQATCLLSGQLIYKADRMLMVKTLREAPSPQQWWNPIWGDILGNLNPLKKMSWQILGLSFQGAFLSIVLGGWRTTQFLTVIPMVMYGVDIGEYVIRSYTLFKFHFLLLYESNFIDTSLWFPGSTVCLKTWEVSDLLGYSRFCVEVNKLQILF